MSKSKPFTTKERARLREIFTPREMALLIHAASVASLCAAADAKTSKKACAPSIVAQFRRLERDLNRLLDRLESI